MQLEKTVKVTMRDKRNDAEVVVHTTPDDYEEDLKKITLADPEGKAKKEKSPFHRYPNLQKVYNNALFQVVCNYVEKEEDNGFDRREFKKIQDFCLHFEAEEFGQAAVDYTKMQKETRLMVTEDFVTFLRGEGYFNHFKTTSSVKNTNQQLFE